MGLIVRPTNEKKIEIPGLDIELESLYVRIEFAGRTDGNTIEIAPIQYRDKDKFKQNKPCISNVPMHGFKVVINEEESQSIDTALKYAKEAYKQLGYEVEIE